MRPGDPAIARAVLALRDVCSCGRPVFRIDAVQKVRAAIYADGPEGVRRWKSTNERERELIAAATAAEQVIWELLAPGSEVHTDRYCEILRRALTDERYRDDVPEDMEDTPADDELMGVSL